MKNIIELHSDYVDTEINVVYLDAYFDTNENNEGKTVGTVCLDTGKVVFFDSRYRNETIVLEAIKEILSSLPVEITNKYHYAQNYF